MAFARHLGFLEAVERAQLPIEGVCGTSSGALVGSLWLAGHPLDEIAQELSAASPLSRLRLSRKPWRGLLSMMPLVERLKTLLPARIEGLDRPFAVGVIQGGAHLLLTEGPLPEAVAASCAMPKVFEPVAVAGVRYQDGGAADRLGVDAWRRWRADRAGIAHHVERTAGQEVQADLRNLRVVKSPRSGAKLWDLGDFEGQRQEAQRGAWTQLQAYLSSDDQP